MAKGNDWWRVEKERQIGGRGRDQVEDPLMDSNGRPRHAEAGHGSRGGSRRRKGAPSTSYLQRLVEDYVPGDSVTKIVRTGETQADKLASSPTAESGKKRQKSSSHKAGAKANSSIDVARRRAEYFEKKKRRIAEDLDYAAEVQRRSNENAGRQAKKKSSFGR